MDLRQLSVDQKNILKQVLTFDEAIAAVKSIEILTNQFLFLSHYHLIGVRGTLTLRCIPIVSQSGQGLQFTRIGRCVPSTMARR